MASEENGHAAVDGRTKPAPVTPIAWLVPTAAVLSLLSLAFPWFEVNASGHGRLDDLATLHAWQDGMVFLVAAVALTLAAAVVVALLLGRPLGRFSALPDPPQAAGWLTVFAAVLAAICVGIEWLLVPSQFSFWTAAKAIYARQGIALGRGPQFGYYLNLAAAALALVAGIAMVLVSRTDPEG